MPSLKNVERAMKLIERDEYKVLGLTFGNRHVQPGQYVSKADAASPPQLSFQRLKACGTYMAVCLDLDAPFASFNFMSPILHWIQPGLLPVRTQSGNYILRVAAPFVADYMGPHPPPRVAPHRYLFILFEQPPGFEVKHHAPAKGRKFGKWPRMRYNLDKWSKKIGLGPVVGANYILCN
ncbi:PEBP-like protein [Aspergillus sclerotioniger CBS 115572]|uniref:PEBP-like protein n=1 Tax=Aspergillus sclerotioniger CBS 115572 TaxID=1450535 RepID=A0A317W938_9EURO|nr:PEBP-like protein [Aspergillus sclerotioniger CBS 115572]PWY81528.1 PEBP-like protein [Aspergillus sclerotioniger CBS 115572]